MVSAGTTCLTIIPGEPGGFQTLVQLHGKPAGYESRSFFLCGLQKSLTIGAYSFQR
jgi:hypothetical protein